MSIKNVFIFVAGAAIGAGGMFLGMKKYFEEKAENKINETINAELEKIHGTKADKSELPVDTKKPEEKPVIKEAPNLDIYKQVLEKKNYNTISAEEKVVSMTDAVSKTVEDITKKSSKKTKAPKRITQEEYDATDDSEKVELQYYADDILADIFDKTYDPAETIGAANLRVFKAHYDTMYIMNYSTNMMYEITFSNSNYRDIAGGVGVN